ncbi:HNH endonuclease signature motif containing protein [Streptomyces sp. NPDC004111]|uniref:HNH endonuclease signature motif containing protein n=1 Tax=Streptomyces sp. NPDC004111 TaxID=3364690 RepID=UPI0036AFB6F9
MARTWADRLLDRLIDAPGGCWIWTGCLDRDGYGRMRVDGRRQYVHRLSYEGLRGRIPAGLEIDHLCRVRACANPDHLEPVPHRVNVLRGESFAALKARQTQCVNGHTFTAGSVYRAPNGTRKCRPCRAAANQRYRQRRTGVHRAPS